MNGTATYDVIIVGARIAGTATAALLAQEGFKVLLLEKTTFPSPTVSCPVVFGNALEVLSRFGAEEVVDRLGAPKLRLYGTDYGFVRVAAHLPPYKGRDYAYSIQRERLDEAVARHVEQLPGVTLREGFSVTELLHESGRVVGVRGREQGGAIETIHARLAVIGADGRNSAVARMVGARAYDTKPAHSYLYYAYYRNVTPLDEPSAMVYRNRPGTALLVFDADQELTVLSIAAVDPPFEQARKDPEAAMQRVLRQVPEVAARFEQAERATPIVGLAPFGMFRRQAYGPGWALVGDAGVRLDPVTGQGIYQGLHTAELLADALVQVRDGRPWGQAMSEFQRLRDAHSKAAYDFAAVQSQLTPQPWLSRRLLKHMAADPALATYYFGTANGATPAEENFNLWKALRLAFTPVPRRQRAPTIAYHGRKG
ncbi:MAG TPA: NAD(P)/FAD-dependent oxidoreductase [Herpetosiphonaceae bacterium]